MTQQDDLTAAQRRWAEVCDVVRDTQQELRRATDAADRALRDQRMVFENLDALMRAEAVADL